MQFYDNIVIGSGPTAYKFSSYATGKTLIVERADFGGICPNFGCEPKIFLDGAARVVLMSRKLYHHGINQLATIDWQTLMARKLATFANYPENSIKLFQSNGADTLQGHARFVEPHLLDIDGETYRGKRIIIASGQRPNKLPIKGQNLTLNSNEVLSMPTVPDSMTLIGGGFVSMELASILNAAGVKVTVVEAANRPLGSLASPHVAQVVKEMTAQGIRFYFNQRVAAVIAKNQGYEVQTADGLKIYSDKVVDASGRVPNVEELNLEAAGVAYDRGGIQVNNHLATSADGVYAAGDVVNKTVPKLTSTAQFEGEYLGRYLSGQISDEIQYPVIAQAAFTFPQIAQAGVPVEDIDKSKYHLITQHMADGDFAYIGLNDEVAELTMVIDGNNKVVGISEVSQTAADDIDHFLPLIGLKMNPKLWLQKQLSVFPALAYKIRDIFG